MSTRPPAPWAKTTLGEGLRQDLWACTEPGCADPLHDLIPQDDRDQHRRTFHDPRDEAAECGECNRPDQFAWDPIRWESGAPVITCLVHASLAPGWAYDSDVEVANHP